MQGLIVLFLNLLLTVHTSQGQVDETSPDGIPAPYGVQWGESKALYLSSAALEEDMLYLSGTRLDRVGWWARVPLSGPFQFQMALSAATDGSTTEAYAVTAHDGALFVAGHSSEGGMFQDWEDQSPVDVNVTSRYGFVVDVSWRETPARRYLETQTGPPEDVFNHEDGHNSTNSSNSQEGIFQKGVVGDITSGVLVGSLPGETSTIAVVANVQHIYALSLASSGLESEQANASRPTLPFDLFGNPSVDDFLGKAAMGLTIDAYERIEYNDTETNALQNLGEHLWTQSLFHGNNESIAIAAGILLVDKFLFVGGSTMNTGEAFGDDPIDEGGMDGFLTKIHLHDGALYGDSNETEGEVSSLRIQTHVDEDEFLFGMCKDGKNEYIYLTGSTTGNFSYPDGSLSHNGTFTKAFLLQVEVATMNITGSFHIATVDEKSAIGLACAVIGNDEHIYFAGNVENGGTLENVDIGGGANDIFLAKVKVSGMELEWVRQVGGPGNEILAPRGGLAVTSSGHALLAGNSFGSLYRYTEVDGVPGPEVFVALVSSEGDVPMVASVPNDNSTGFVPTAAPTNATIGTDVPTVAPTNATFDTEAPTYNSTNATMTATPTSQPSLAPTDATVDTNTPTAAPTLAPTNVTTNAPTASPTTDAPSTLAPTMTTQSFIVNDLTIRLVGASRLTNKTRQVFQSATEEFYQTVYPGRRRLQSGEDLALTDFETTVTYKSEDVNTTGNSITYDQSISFRSPIGNISQEQVNALIVEPFEDDQRKAEYLEILVYGDRDFGNVTSVGTPQLDSDRSVPVQEQSPDNNDDDDDGPNIIIFIIIGVCVLLCCVCGFFLWLRQNSSADAGKRPDYDDPEDGFRDDPEQHQYPDQARSLVDSEYDVYDAPPPDRSGGGDFGMSAIGNDVFLNELSGAGPTAGFGTGFDHTEKRSNLHDTMEDNDFGLMPGLPSEEFGDAAESLASGNVDDTAGGSEGSESGSDSDDEGSHSDSGSDSGSGSDLGSRSDDGDDGSTSGSDNVGDASFFDDEGNSSAADRFM